MVFSAVVSLSSGGMATGLFILSKIIFANNLPERTIPKRLSGARSIYKIILRHRVLPTIVIVYLMSSLVVNLDNTVKRIDRTEKP